MRSMSLFCVLAFLCNTLSAQYVYTIKADSVKLTNCDSSELIIENHTQTVKGFLFNTHNGRTIFKRGAQKLNDSLYLIGDDTLNLGAKAWVQGGNSFNDTGFLGTLNNTHLDLYTNNLRRARLTNTGRFLLGATTDNGNLLQVNGSASFTGNANIGSATVTNTGQLIGTNAILFNHVVSQYHLFQVNDMYISKLDNVLYNYQNRFSTTQTTDPDGSMHLDIVIPPDEGPGITYVDGKMCFSFWSGSIPQSVSVQYFDYNAMVWRGPYISSTNLTPVNSGGYFEVALAGNYANEFKITLTAKPGVAINLQNIEYVPLVGNQGLLNANPYLGKTDPEHTFNYLYFKNARVDNVRLSPFLTVPNYFLNQVLIGSATDNSSGSKLQVTGNLSATGSLGLGIGTPAAQLHTTGSVRFAGLTNNNTQTRILVSDTSGNLYYRDASTLAANDIIHSSLAVNGPIRAQQLILSAHDWPDYVFDSAYQLLPLPHLERYIQQHNHLPGIPSAAVVENKGTDVAETQAVMLKKIEELTLYIIEQNKKIDSLSKQVNQIRKTELINRK